MIRNILIVVVFLLSGLAGVLLLPELKFSFNFEQFFPRNDKELDFYSQTQTAKASQWTHRYHVLGVLRCLAGQL